MTPQVTILMPTFDHGPTIRLAASCALNQTIRDVELFVIGDGVPDAAKRHVRELVETDRRVRFYDNPKHSRRGEPYRHLALQEARGRYVCQLTDRDLWLPDHVERMGRLLRDADFAHSLSLHLLPNGSRRFFPTDLARPELRRRMLTLANRVPFSCAAYTLEMYRRLPHGWQTTPEGKATDYHMFQQFLADDTCRAVSGTYPSALTFPSPPRASWSTEERMAELELWSGRISTEDGRRRWVIDTLESAVRDRDREIEHAYFTLRIVKDSPFWRARGALLSHPLVRPIAARLRRRRRESRDDARD